MISTTTNLETLTMIILCCVFIKRGNAPFKQALKDWIKVNDTDSWHVGASIANQQMNNRPHEGRDMLIPYQIYYHQEDERMFKDIIGGSTWHILTEVGWQVVEGVMEYLKKFHPSMHLEDDDVRTFATDGDTLL
jgi:hypothetical protein